MPALLQWQDAGNELAAALKRGYADAGKTEALLKQAQASFRAEPEPQASFDGVSLLLPDQYCVDSGCVTTQAVDAAWVVRRLRSLLQ